MAKGKCYDSVRLPTFVPKQDCFKREIVERSTKMQGKHGSSFLALITSTWLCSWTVTDLCPIIVVKSQEQSW